MTLGSLFDGAGGFPLAGEMAGFTPLWASEIEPFPIRVTTKRFPNMRHLGNITKISGKNIEPVDVITFGSPCQDLSVAGKRAGLDGERSGLFMEAIRIIKEMREETNGKSPTFIVWENVPGAFSSNKGEDFRTVLEEIAKIADGNVTIPRPDKGKWFNAGEIVGDGYSIAWRVLDAQFWGVPQRRKRIYLVADFADRRAGKILFERESVSGYSAESFRAWQRTATAAENGSGATGAVCLNDQGGQSIDVGENRCSEVAVKAYGICSKDSNSMKSDNPHSGIYQAETARTLDGNGGNPSCNQGGIVIVCVDQGGGKSSCSVSEELSPTLTCTHGGEPAVCVQGSMIGRADKNGPQGSGINEGVSFTLNATDRHAVAFSQEAYDRYAENTKCGSLRAAGGMYGGGSETLVYSTSKASYHTDASENLANTLVASDYKDPPTVVKEPQYIVRRLTPTECARLQGFPDWWAQNLDTAEPTEEDLAFWADVFETHRKATDPAKKPKTKSQIKKWLQDPQTDSAEYKMWGNSLAIPCAYTVLAGIAEELTESKVTK